MGQFSHINRYEQGPAFGVEIDHQRGTVTPFLERTQGGSPRQPDNWESREGHAARTLVIRNVSADVVERILVTLETIALNDGTLTLPVDEITGRTLPRPSEVGRDRYELSSTYRPVAPGRGTSVPVASPRWPKTAEELAALLADIPDAGQNSSEQAA